MSSPYPGPRSATVEGSASLNPGWRLEELALPWAKIYNPYRVEIGPTKHTHPLSPSQGGRGFIEFDLGIPWRVRAATGRGERPGRRDPM